MNFLRRLFGGEKAGEKGPALPSAKSATRAAPAMMEGLTAVETADVEFLLGQPYGSAVPMSVSDSGRIVTALVFRESQSRIAELAGSGALASAHIRSSLLGVSGVQIYVTLIRLGDQAFEIWWNWHNPVIRPLFERLFDQDEVIIGFVSDRPTIDRTCRYPSSVKGPLRANRSKLTGAPPWTMEAFDRARAVVEKEYPTPVALWHALGGRS